MGKVTGPGGFFFKTEDPQKTATWMTDVLGVPMESWGQAFPWRDHEDPTKEGQTVIGLHKTSSDYFGPSKQPFMLNFRVEGIDDVVKDLEAKGVTIIKRPEPSEYGAFAHVAGPDGITIELWEPPPPAADTDKK